MIYLLIIIGALITQDIWWVIAGIVLVFLQTWADTPAYTYRRRRPIKKRR